MPIAESYVVGRIELASATDGQGRSGVRRAAWRRDPFRSRVPPPTPRDLVGVDCRRFAVVGSRADPPSAPARKRLMPMVDNAHQVGARLEVLTEQLRQEAAALLAQIAAVARDGERPAAGDGSN